MVGINPWNSGRRLRLQREASSDASPAIVGAFGSSQTRPLGETSGETSAVPLKAVLEDRVPYRSHFLVLVLSFFKKKKKKKKSVAVVLSRIEKLE